MRIGRGIGMTALLAASLAANAWCDYSDYFVSPAGNNVRGDGSLGNPWRTVQHALNRIDYARGYARINLAPGTYSELLDIRRTVCIRGLGTAENPSVIDYTGTRERETVVDIGDAGGRLIVVCMENLAIGGHGERTYPNRAVDARNTALLMRRVGVFMPRSWGIRIEECPAFLLQNCELRSGPIGDPRALYHMDVGVRIDRSTGFIERLTAGDYIDHVVDILEGSNVWIRDSDLTGSTVHWADGVRISGASNVSITGTRIERPAAELTTAGSDGVEISVPAVYTGSAWAPPEENAGVCVEDCVIRGFGTGIDCVLGGASRVMVEGCEISGLTQCVRTAGPDTGEYPRVNFGDGDTCAGDNVFDPSSPCAFYHGCPYDVMALYNSWGVPRALIGGRIRDGRDAGARGVGLVRY